MVTDDHDCFEFDMQHVPVQRRSRVWMDALNNFFYDYDYSLPAEIVTGEFTGGYANECSVARIKSDAMSVFRNMPQINKDGLDAYFVLLPSDHQIALRQRGRESVLERRHFAIVSTSDTYSYI